MVRLAAEVRRGLKRSDIQTRRALLTVRLAAEVRRGLKPGNRPAINPRYFVRLAAEVRRGLKLTGDGATNFGRSPRC